MRIHRIWIVLAGLACAGVSDAAEFSPLPACLDPALHRPDRDGFLSTPLPLSSCPPDGPAGDRRIAGDDGEVLYLFQLRSGSAISTGLLVGRERHDGDASALIDGRVYVPARECAGLVDAWTEPDGRIRVILNLSPLSVLHALVAPRAQPPSAGRDGPTLRALLGERAKQSLDLGHSCFGYAEYELDPGSLVWRLDALRFDIEDRADEDAFSALLEIVPALDSAGIAMLLEPELTEQRNALRDALPRERIPPADDTQLDADYAVFSARLQAVVRDRDSEGLIAMAEESVMLGFGGSGGHADLREWFRDPAVAEDDWQNLETVLRLGAVRMGAEVFCLPYPGCIDLDPDSSLDPFRVRVVISPDAALLERPQPNARLLRLLDFDVVHLAGPLTEDHDPFRRIRSFDGEIGYVDSAALRSPLEMRMEVARGAQGWRVRSIVEGD